MLSNSHVILSVSEGSQDPNMRFFRLLWEDKSKDSKEYSFVPINRQSSQSVLLFRTDVASNASISRCRQNDKMIVSFHFDTPSFVNRPFEGKRLPSPFATVALPTPQ